MVIFYFGGLWLMKAKMFKEFRNRTFALCPETRRRQLLSKTVAQKQVSSASPTLGLSNFSSRFPGSDHDFSFCCLYLCERVWVSIRACVRRDQRLTLGMLLHCPNSLFLETVCHWSLIDWLANGLKRDGDRDLSILPPHPLHLGLQMCPALLGESKLRSSCLSGNHFTD